MKVPKSELDHRKINIQAQLQQAGIDGLLITQSVDMLYFSGTRSNGFLYIPCEGDPLLLIKQRRFVEKKEFAVKNMVGFKSIGEIPNLISDFYGRLPSVLAFELDVLPVNNFNRLRGIFTEQNCVDGSVYILKVRRIKSNWEIEQMENTGRVFKKTFEYAKAAIRPGLSEMEFAGMMEAFARNHSPDAFIRVRDIHTEGYPWHILSGKSGGMVGLLDSPASGEGTSAAFPCGAGSKRLAANEPIMIDFVFELNGYHMDVTRMFSIGAMPKRAMKACQGAMEIHDNVLKIVKPGVTVDELFRYSVSCARRLGYEEPYLGPPGEKVSFIGHGIGLELIEGPIIAENKQEKLEPGMTFALEPKMVFKNKFSASIESVFVVTDEGHRMISQVPVEVFIC
ncbi:MAG: Xaa-Pro peptidase family protein [Thermodesulfobacteriota bacterium]|nr:Xaa-Pro peptidase family protein [Thermodesulfobacteriota bacterium]